MHMYPLLMVHLLAISGSITPLTIPSGLFKKKSYHRQASVVALCMLDEMVREMMDGGMFVSLRNQTLAARIGFQDYMFVQ